MASLGCTSGGERPPGQGGVAGAAPLDDREPLQVPFAVDHHFVPTGFMGDGADGVTLVHELERCLLPRPEGAQGECHRVQYSPKTSVAAEWAGLYWQNEVNNWGEQPGIPVVPGARAVSFSAASEPAGLEVTFLAGGIDSPGRPHRDGFAEAQVFVLGGDYARFELSLDEVTYETVLGGFGLVVTVLATRSLSVGDAPVSVYVDDVQWR
jgi:hypothetical protein